MTNSSSKLALVTGAGSGVGRSVSFKLASQGWRVIVVGRTISTLQESASHFPSLIHPHLCDVSDPSAVEQMAADVLSTHGPLQALVNSAGTNVIRRKLDELSVEDYRHILDVNLNGTFYCCRSFLPSMKQQGGGTIVNVVSDAGLTPNAVSGAAYVASKFGAVGLTGTINAEHRQHNIRACAILPGVIDTPLLKKRPVYPSDEERFRMLQPDDVADCVLLAINLPARATVEQLLVRPTR